MNRKQRSAAISLWANRFACLIATVLVFLMPQLIRWYTGVRQLSVLSQRAILIAFYLCMIFVYLSQWIMERLLRNLLIGAVFVRKNVKLIRKIRLYCGTIGVICLPAAAYYLPLVFVAVIMAFLCLVVNVVADVMHGAVEMREESELTI